MLQITLSLTVTFGASDNDARRGRAIMNNWIDDEIAQTKRDNEDRIRQGKRAELIDHQVSGLWNDLRFETSHALTKINSSPELCRKLGCEIRYHEPNDSSFQINKEVYPAVFLEVNNHGRYFAIRWVFVANGQSQRDTDKHEKLEIALDTNDRVYLMTESNKVLHMQDAVKHLLQPILNHTT